MGQRFSSGLSNDASSVIHRLNGDGGDGALGFVEVGVASGQSTHGEQVAVAEIIGDAVQAPAGEGYVGGGEGEG